MRTRIRVGFALALMLVSGCGSEATEDSPAFELGWQFDYRALGSDTPALRGCENGDGESIAAVRVVMTAQNAIAPAFDATFGCAEGDRAATEIRDIPNGTYSLVAEALISNEVLYRIEDPAFEVRGGGRETITLSAVVGELRLAPELEGSSACPANIERISAELFRVVDDAPLANSTTQRLIDEPCAGNELAPIFIEQIPADLEALSDGSTPVEYRIVIEASSASGPLGCLALLARVPPGAPSSPT
ncbi:MAG: hypothetical protein AAF658_19590, partial [Myxococcota bacterium]